MSTASERSTTPSLPPLPPTSVNENSNRSLAGTQPRPSPASSAKSSTSNSFPATIWASAPSISQVYHPTTTSQSSSSTNRTSPMSNPIRSVSTSARRARRGSITFEASRIESKHFSAKELQNLAKQFNTWTNKNNMMDREGFRKSLGLLGMVQDALLCHQLFRVFNRSGSGQIDFEEYVNGLGVLMKGSLDEKLDFSFNMTDIDGSGEISFEELVLTVDSMMRIYAGIMGGQQSTVIDKEKIRRVFSHLDRNHDGRISVDEYKNGMKRHPEFLNTLRGTELFRVNTASSLRAANHRIDRLEHAMADVLRELYQAEAAMQTLKSSMNTNGFAPSPLPTPPPSKSQNSSPTKSQNGISISVEVSPAASVTGDEGDGDDHTIDETEEEEAVRTVECSLLKARSIVESLLPPSQRPERRPAPNLIKPATPVPLTGSRISSEEEKRENAEDNINHNNSSVSQVLQGEEDLTSQATRDKAVAAAEARIAEAEDEWAEDELPPGSGLPPLPSSANKRKGLTVYFGHKNWDLVVNVMKGIQMAVSRSALEQDRPVSPYDFSVKEKYTLVSGLEAKTGSTSDSHRTRFVDYAPFVFAKLREFFHIDHEEYMNSIGPGSMLSNLMLGSLSSLAEMGSEGKSGSFFYLSSDNRFLVKTVRKDEHKLLRHILPSYFRHMTKVGQGMDVPDSMLTRIVGCHVVRSSKRSKTRTGAQKVYFVVMTNALETDLEIHRRYDLKGSWIGRRTSQAGREDPQKTLKDVDLLESQDRIFVEEKMKRQLMAALRRDATFLESHHIIDYSVLLGVHNHSLSAVGSEPQTSEVNLMAKENSNGSIKSGQQPPQQPQISTVSSSHSLVPPEVQHEPPFFTQFHGGFRSPDLKQTYFMGIIDFLTQYGERKRLERFVKTIAHFNSAGLSVMPARAYAKRFLAFMDEKVIVSNVDRTTYFAPPAQQQLSTDVKTQQRSA